MPPREIALNLLSAHPDDKTIKKARINQSVRGVIMRNRTEFIKIAVNAIKERSENGAS